MTTEVGSRSLREPGVFLHHSSAAASLSNPVETGPPSSRVESKNDSNERKRRRNGIRREQPSKRRKERDDDDEPPRQRIDTSLLDAAVPEIGTRFDVLEKVGEGTFSSVFKASTRGKPQRLVALKHILPTSSPARIANELQSLHVLEGKHNVIKIESSIRYEDQVVLVLPYFPHVKIQDYIGDVTFEECCDYMQALFAALRHVHSYAIVHRDVKPGNFLYNRQAKEFRLVDFGLAHLVPGVVKSNEIGEVTNHDPRQNGLRQSLRPLSSPSTRPTSTAARHSHQRAQRSTTTPAWRERSVPSESRLTTMTTTRSRHASSGDALSQLPDVRLCSARHKINELCNQCCSRDRQSAARAGTTGFRAFEVLLKCPHQTTAIDIWSAGIIFLCLLTGHYPFFKGQNDLEALAGVVAVFGTSACTKAAKAQGKQLTSNPNLEGLDLKDLCFQLRHGSDYVKTRCQCSKNEHRKPNEVCWLCVPDSAFNLLLRCLDLNPATRITADEALKHVLFRKS
ncbi:cell division cycle 7-related protein kinase-like [Oscarella lobularis]|uniref:cell division cycle 7-related protein kinase-like n=1 Tax=Oscarella lobularis TaxID=121494 RepID=UPI003313C961